MDRNGRKLKKSLKERKAEIDYTKIDRNIRTVVRLLNKFPFLITTSCCEGHPSAIGFDHFVAEGYVTMDIFDEKKFIEVMKEITSPFLKKTGLPLNLTKHYIFGEEGRMDGDSHYRLAYYFGFESVEEGKKALRKCQQCLRTLLLDYQRRHKDVLDR